MDRIAIRGFGKFGKYIKQLIDNSESYRIVCYGDEYADAAVSELPVYRDAELLRKKEIEWDETWIAVKNYEVLADICIGLHKTGFSKCKYVDPKLWDNKKSNSCERLDEEELNKNLHDLVLDDRAVLGKLEIHLCDHCNLNCKGCSHFAPVLKEHFLEYVNFKKDIDQLASRFSRIFRLRLMGGEPLLHPNICDFLKYARMRFPESHLELVTNGLLLYKMDDAFWNTLRKERVFVCVSLYPPIYNQIEKVEELLEAYSIEYSLGSGLEQSNPYGVIEEFHKCLTRSGQHNPEVSSHRCFGAKCHYLREGKISKCAVPLLIEQVNARFGTDYIVEESDYIDIYDYGISIWEQVEKMEKSIPFCRYCSEDPPMRFSWKTSNNPQLEDYVI